MAQPPAADGEASLVAGAEGRAVVRGALTFATVTHLETEGRRLIGDGVREIDLGEVTRADSAGLALLVGWLAAARERGATLRYVGMPERLRAIARISEVDELLAGSG